MGLLLSTLAIAAAHPDLPGLKSVDAQAYVVHTDLPADQVAGVIRRLDAMTREYTLRTASLSARADDRRLPLYLYSREADYLKAGGQPGSSGFFDGERLLAVVGDRADTNAWHVIQHEAFHQFIMAKLGDDMPIWLNEGLAEYFGEGVYTGDNFVTGNLPGYRINRLRDAIRARKVIPFSRLIGMSHEQWNKDLDPLNYDIAWSLVHFLAHGDNGAYQADLLRYIQATAKNNDPVGTFRETIDTPEAVQAAWAEYWLNLTPAEVNRPWASLTAQTLTSFLARATIARQHIASLDELAELARTNRLAQPANDRLPIELLNDSLKLAEQVGQWQFDQTSRAHVNVTLSLSDDSQILSRFILRQGRVFSIQTWDQFPNNTTRRSGRRLKSAAH